MPNLLLYGDVTDRQTFLNGTRTYLVDGHCPTHGSAASWTLAVTVPREEGEPIAEGDFTIVVDGFEWCADVIGGTYRFLSDDPDEGADLQLRLELLRRPDAESALPWQRGTLEARVFADVCEGSLEVTSDG